MKSSGKITGILLLLLIAGNGALKAQRGMRGMMDTTRMNRPGRGMDRSADSLSIRDLRNGADSMHMRGMRNGMGPMSMNRMGRGMGQMPIDRMGQRPMGPAKMIIESIPDLTEKQKKDIGDLRMKQQGEMKKYRNEMTAKMKSMRETNRKKMLDLLTPEQKKLFESGSGNTNPVPSRVK